MYPSVNDKADLDWHLSVIPENLKLLPKPLLISDKHVTLWRQKIARTTRPRLVVPPLPMCFAVQIENPNGYFSLSY